MRYLSLLFRVFYLFKLSKRQTVGTIEIRSKILLLQIHKPINQMFSDVFRRYRSGTLVKNSLKYFNNFSMHTSSAIQFHLDFSAPSNKSRSKF